MKTKTGIRRPDLIPEYVARFYHFALIGWKLNIKADGSWEGERQEGFDS